MNQMAKLSNKTSKKRSKFRTLSQKISIDIEKIILNLSDVSNQCSCGCSRPIKSIQSYILQSYFCSKSRWIRMLHVKRDRISELSSIYDMIASNGCTEHTFNSLDLNLVKSDIKRQPWVSDNETVDLVSKSIYTFCIYNNVAYWQGMHDVASALIHLTPRPSIGELAALIEQLYRIYSPIVFSPTTKDVTSKANSLSLKWRLLFQYFFPKFSHDFDTICDPSFTSGWFITLGFYRFGCAYIPLSYMFLLVISRYEPLESFFFRELGYVAMRGYLGYLLENNITLDFNSSVIFSNYSNTNLIVNTIVNSNKLELDCEKYINVSRNPFDKLNFRELELSDFPLIYIFKASNILCNSAPSVNSIDPSKQFIEISPEDIFSQKDNSGIFECHLDSIADKDDLNLKSYGKKLYHKRLIKHRRQFSFTHSQPTYSISDKINSELAFTYLSSLRRFGDLYFINKRKYLTKTKDLDLSFGSLSNPKIQYNIIDVRSQYLKSGVPLEKIFGNNKSTILDLVNPDEVLESSFLDTNFTMWIVMTDHGYNVGTDQQSIESLNKGLQVMLNLSIKSITCLAMFRDGYKGLLRLLKEEVPERPSILSMIKVRKFLSWDQSEQSPISPTRNLSEITSSLASAAIDFEHRIVQGISDMKLFNRFRPSEKLHKTHSIPQLPVTTSANSHSSVSVTSSFDINNNDLSVDFDIISNRISTRFSTYYKLRDLKPSKIKYCFKLIVASGLEVSIMSNRTIKINGMILHPSQYPKVCLNQKIKILMFLSTLFTVNCVDRVMDLEPLSYGRGKFNYHFNKFFVNKTKDLLSRFIVLFTEFSNPFDLFGCSTDFKHSFNHRNEFVHPFIFCFTLLTMVGGIVCGNRMTGIRRFTDVYFVDSFSILDHLVNCYRPHFEVSIDTDNRFQHDFNTTDYQGFSISSDYQFEHKSSNQQISFDDLIDLNDVKDLKDLKSHDVNKDENHRTVNVKNIPYLKNVKVFSRTHDLSSRRSVSSSTSVETRVYVNPKNGDNMPKVYNPNVFVSRSSLNRRNNSK